VNPDSSRWTDVLAQARERLLSGEEREAVAGPRQEILDSWRRSYDDGASESGLSSPYDEHLDLSSRLVRAARPVIDRVHEDVLGSPITVVLADSRGKVLLRKSGEQSLEARLDNALLAPGFNYAEKYVGTNGIGTALEGRATSMVSGFEHFNEQLQVFACVGVPLRDPVSRRQLGVLDITTWADRASPALTALVRQAATVIEEGLLQLSGRGARELLGEYLVSSRNREGQVLAIGEEALIGAPAVTRILGGLGRDELWPIVRDSLGTRNEAEIPLLLEGSRSLLLRVRAVRGDQGMLAGAIAEVSEQLERQPDRAPALPALESPSRGGLSPLTIGPGVMVRRLAAARMPVCLIGEPGVGKRTMAETVAGETFPGRTVSVHDPSALPAKALVAEVCADLTAGHPVLLRCVDLLEAGTIGRLVTEVSSPAADTGQGWLVLTLQSGGAARGDRSVEAELSAAGIPMVVLPPLRSRPQDLHQILPVMVRRASGGRVREVTRQLSDRLVRESWPGNLTEVAELVATMVRGATGGTLDVPDLPAGFGSGLRRRLTPMEWIEREAIVDALRGCGGDKQLAAEALGISRASVYRKVKAFGIEPAEL